MLKLWKDAEIRELEKQKKIEAEAKRKIASFEAIEQRRKEKIAVNERKYNQEKASYDWRCMEFVHDQPAFIRFCFLIHQGLQAEKNGSITFLGYINSNLKSYNLIEFRDWINSLCPPGATPPVKKELSEKDLEV
jgi:hypothetical protein